MAHDATTQAKTATMPAQATAPAKPLAPKAPEPKADPIAAQDKKIAELTDTLKHLQADFENHIKRNERQRQELCDQAGARVLAKILTVVDDFERAYAQLEKAQLDPKLKEGFALVNKNVHKLLDDEGVRPIECVGKKLDPFKHEVLRKVKKDGAQDGIVLEEHQRGYMLKDKVLRYAKVSVADNGDA